MGETFTTEIQARYRDINLAGHVDNVEAVRVLDEARYEFLRFARLPGLPEGATGLLHGVDAGVSELVASQNIEYHAEMRFVPYQPFVAVLGVSRVGRSSFAGSAEAYSGEVSSFIDLETELAPSNELLVPISVQCSFFGWGVLEVGLDVGDTTHIVCDK